MAGINFIGLVIMVFGIIVSCILYNDDGRYFKSSIATLVVAFVFMVTCMFMSIIYNDYDEMFLRLSGKDFRCIDLPAEDFMKCGIDLSKDKPFIMRHYYVCSRQHNHENEPCTKDKLCYRAYFVKDEIADEYDTIIRQIEKTKTNDEKGN